MKLNWEETYQDVIENRVGKISESIGIFDLSLSFKKGNDNKIKIIAKIKAINDSKGNFHEEISEFLFSKTGLEKASRWLQNKKYQLLLSSLDAKEIEELHIQPEKLKNEEAELIKEPSKYVFNVSTNIAVDAFNKDEAILALDEVLKQNIELFKDVENVILLASIIK